MRRLHVVRQLGTQEAAQRIERQRCCRCRRDPGGDPAIARLWSRQTLPPDARRVSNARGTISFAQFKPDDRTTTLFINLRDNPQTRALLAALAGRAVPPASEDAPPQ